MAAVVMFGAVACSQYDEQEVVEGQEVTTTFAIGLENLGTRVAGDSGMIDKVAWGIYEHQADGSGRFLAVHSSCNSAPADFDGEKAEIEVTLFTGKKYDLVFFGYCSANNAYSIDWEARELNVNYSDLANLEARDAFYHVEPAFTAGTNKTFTLRRPFAQLNVGQSMEDFGIMQLTGNYIEKSSVTVKAYSKMKLTATKDEKGQIINSGPVVDESVDVVTLNMNNVVSDDLTVNEVAYKHIAMNYLLVNEKQVVNDVVFKFTENTTTGKPTEFTRTYHNVPLQRNYRTNILGRIISDEYNFEIVIDADFNEPDNIIFHAFQYGGVVDLTSNTEVSNPQIVQGVIKDGVEQFVEVVLNLNGHTIENKGGNKTQVIEVAKGNKLTINGEGTLVGGSAADYGFISNGNAVLNNVNVNSKGGGVAVTNGGKLTFSGDVYVDSSSTSGRYIFYTRVEGSELIIKGGNFSWNTAKNDKRAYVYAEAGTTVRIEGGNFGKPSTRSDYKAGIMGTGTVIITGGTFGFNPSAWVADGYTAIKEGAKWYVVEEGASVIANASALTNAIASAADGAIIVLAAGTYEGCFDIKNKSNITIKSTQDAHICGMTYITDSNVKFEGIKFSNPNAVLTTPSVAGDLVDQKVNGMKPVVGVYVATNVEFNNCKFDINGDAVYGFSSYASTNATFNACEFECYKKRPIATNGAQTTVDGCTFNNQYHYSLRIFENSGALQTVVYTNNTVIGSNDKGEFEGINISKKGGSAVVLGNFTIKDNTADLKYRHHKDVTMATACVYDTDIANFAFEKEN